jgi:hypothetical protein
MRRRRVVLPLIKTIRARLTATDERSGEDGATMFRLRLDEVDDNAPLLLASSRA